MITKQDVLRWLDELGKTVPEIVQSLSNLGIKGDPGTCSSCPIALYLKSKGIVTCYVGDVIQSYTTNAQDSFCEIWFSTPILISEFINQFDAGDFPQLIAIHHGHYPTFEGKICD